MSRRLDGGCGAGEAEGNNPREPAQWKHKTLDALCPYSAHIISERSRTENNEHHMYMYTAGGRGGATKRWRIGSVCPCGASPSDEDEQAHDQALNNAVRYAIYLVDRKKWPP